eukprot:SAG11_NODE_22268_length_409_cov_0.670968_1_plen_75_part_01
MPARPPSPAARRTVDAGAERAEAAAVAGALKQAEDLDPEAEPDARAAARGPQPRWGSAHARHNRGAAEEGRMPSY